MVWVKIISNRMNGEALGFNAIFLLWRVDLAHIFEILDNINKKLLISRLLTNSDYFLYAMDDTRTRAYKRTPFLKWCLLHSVMFKYILRQQYRFSLSSRRHGPFAQCSNRYKNMQIDVKRYYMNVYINLHLFRYLNVHLKKTIYFRVFELPFIKFRWYHYYVRTSNIFCVLFII